MDVEGSLTSAVDTRLRSRAVRPSRHISDLAEDVREGLLRPPRSLPPKYFYDEHGSWLFERICDTPEYYPTRTEDALLARYSESIITDLRPDHIVEFGAGASRKTRHLIEACDRVACPAAYWPFDVCEEIMMQVGRDLIEAYPWLTIEALVGDYHGGLDNLPLPSGRTLYLFLGGTLGNFDHDEANQFLTDVRELMDPDDNLLLGVDRVKDPLLLERAYNDEAGVTAAFNLNVLNVLNNELGGDLNPENFRHKAVYNEAAQRIEMSLVVERDHTARLSRLGEVLEFSKGEEILTEISRKFTLEHLRETVTRAGLEIESHFEPEDEYFSLVLLAPV